MDTYLARLKQFLKLNQISFKDKRVLIAFSGGPDSMFLLHLLRCFSGDLNLKEVSAAYFNHKARHSNDQEAIYLKKLCEDWGVELYIGEARQKKKSEEAFRRARYAFLEQVRAENGFDYIATAHTKTDNAETILMKIIRGTYFGLQGIRPRSGKLIRPLLCFTRAEVEKYLRSYGISYVVDPTNYQRKFFRNYVRHELFPRLQGLNANIEENLYNISFFFNLDNDYLYSQLNLEDLPRNILRVEDFLALPFPMRLRLMRENLKRLMGTDNPLVSKHLFLFYPEQQKFRIALKKGWWIERSYDYIFIYKDDQPVSAPIEIKQEGTFVFNGFKVRVEITGKAPDMFKDVDFYVFDYEALKLPLKIRNALRGEKIGLFGGHRRKLSDVFIDHKIPRPLRQLWPVVTDSAGEVVCVPGIARSKVAPITEHSRKFLYIKLDNFTEIR